MLFREKETAKDRHMYIEEGDYVGYEILYSHLVVGIIVLTLYAITVIFKYLLIYCIMLLTLNNSKKFLIKLFERLYYITVNNANIVYYFIIILSFSYSFCCSEKLFHKKR